MNLYSIRAHDHVEIHDKGYDQDEIYVKRFQFFSTQTEALKIAKAMNKIGYADVIMVYKHDFPTDKKSLVAVLNLLTLSTTLPMVGVSTPDEQRLGEVEVIWENPE